MKRLVALLVAVGLVALSIVVRNVIDGDEGDGGTASDDGGGGDDAEGPLVCATELEDVCRELAADAGLDVVVEDPGDTAARLIGLDDDTDPEMAAWLVPAPWPAIVADSRERASLDPVIADPSAPLARTGLVAVGLTERLAVLTDTCGGLTGTCLAQYAGDPWTEAGGSSTWGSVRPALDDPGISTAVLVGLQSVVASLTGRDDFARNDIETGPVLTGIEDLASVEPNTTAAGTPLSLLLRFGPGSYDVVVELAAVAEPAVAASASRDTLTVVPESGITVDVVLVAPEGRRAPLDTGDATAALIDAGWDDASSGPATGTLNPGVYVALQEAWQEAA